MIYDQKLVSVIVPAYNCEDYIKDCMNSVINQTYTNWEMIIVNDCSTDNTKRVIEEFIEEEPRIQLYNLEKNSGAATARNYAIEKSKGRFIAFLDADDMWKREKLDKQLTFMNLNSYGFTFTGYEMINEEKNKKQYISVPQKIRYKDYLKNTIIGNLTVILDRNVLGEIYVEIGELEDVLTWMRILKNGFTAYGLNDNLAQYRVVGNSVSSNKFKNASRYYKLLRKKQNLGFLTSLYCQIGYMLNATWKRIR